MQFHREEIPHFPNHITEQTGFFWQTIHDKRSGVKIIQRDPKNLNISDYGKETSLFSGSGNLWPLQLTTEKRRNGYFWNSEKWLSVSKHPRFQSLCACSLFPCKKWSPENIQHLSAATATYATARVEQAGLTNPSVGQTQAQPTGRLAFWKTTGRNVTHQLTWWQ